LLSFAYSLLHSGQQPMLQELLKWVYTQSDLMNGDWISVQAEALRKSGQHELALSQLEGLQTQPPAAATRALTYLDEDNFALAREAALAGLGEQYSGRAYRHSLGDPEAICRAALALADILEGLYDTAIASADRAIGSDKRCPIGWLAKAKAL